MMNELLEVFMLSVVPFSMASKWAGTLMSSLNPTITPKNYLRSRNSDFPSYGPLQIKNANILFFSSPKYIHTQSPSKA